MQRRSQSKRTIDSDESGTPVSVHRRSKRTTKFSSSFKEPGMLTFGTVLEEPDSGSKKRKTVVQKEKTIEIKSDSEESEERPVKRRTSDRLRPKRSVDPSSSSSSSVLGTPLANKTRASKRVKSPAIRHSSARKKIQLEEDNDNDDDDEEEDEESEDGTEGESSDSSDVDEEDELEPVKIQRIIAVRMETRRKWMEICEKINTSEIENGSRWFQEEPNEADLDKYEERFLVKWADLSFLHCSWEKKDDLIEQVENAKTYLTTFFRKSHHGYIYDADERMDGDYFDPGFVQIERILEVNPPDGWETKSMMQKKKKQSKFESEWGIIHDTNHPDYENGTGRVFLVKWMNTPYSDATYEYERDLILMDVEYESYVEECEERNRKPTKLSMKQTFSLQEGGKRRLYKIFGDRVKDEMKEKRIEDFKKKLEETEFRNGGKLRDYQAEGVSWLLSNHVNKRSAILADEMGLGKTIQTAAYVEMLHSDLNLRGPFLIIAPLSTIPHWQREFSGWTGLNTIVYHGSSTDRKIIREFEFPFECDRPLGPNGINQRYLSKCHKKNASKAERLWMAQVVITTPEMLVTDDFSELTAVEWELLVVDEAHRLKSHSSKLAVNLRDDRFVFNHILLLTGTPIQNNMNELWALMNIIDPNEFDSCEDFMNRYDNMQSKDRVDELHSIIRPYILRRLKEDVEKSVPPKEETLIEVELTVLQKQYYRALYEKNVQFLHREAKKALDGPSLNNLSMQLRKCCNHPFLLEGVEELVKRDAVLESHDDEADFIIKASGKLVLLDKLLPKLQDGGHRVLIFSQFKIMLDIIEDYLSLRHFKFERIDGSITGKKRQMAIDRFQSKSMKHAPFVMLLSTRAGGVGINLTAADTCIIFDSDWNPQNDLQAQARCHRIGQTKSVKVYRLLTRKTYEMQMFHMSSLKMGLDQAVLQGIENGGIGDDSNNMTKEEVEKLLRFGAYDIFQEENEGKAEKESTEFLEQDIDTILARRSKTVIHDNTGSKSNAAGGTFSKASFKAFGGSNSNDNTYLQKDVDIDDPDFWTKMVGEVKAEKSDILPHTKKRSSNKTSTYNIKALSQNPDHELVESDESSTDEESDDEFEGGIAVQKELDDFDFSTELMSDKLKQIMEYKKKRLSQTERKLWGGKENNEWTKADVILILKKLLRYGYGNLPWDIFLSQFRTEASKDYDDIEIKRMCWSLCFTALLEATQHDTNHELQSDAHSQSMNIITKSGETDHDSKTNKNKPEKTKIENRRSSFERYWSSNQWMAVAFEDAKQYTETKKPRDLLSSVSDRSDETLLFELRNYFKETIAPALKNRGWKENTPSPNSRRKAYFIAPDGTEFSSIAGILDKLPSLYPELEGPVESITMTLCKKISDYCDRSNSVTNSKLVCNKFENMTRDKLSLLLRKYSPNQLLMDAERAKKLNLHSRRMLNNLSYTYAANVFVTRAKDISNNTIDYEKLSKILSPNPKASVPHPCWNPLHDAVLVTAITKHGWIDREKHCHDIMEDQDIKWGLPFDDFCNKIDTQGNQAKLSTIKYQSLRCVADRAARFLNDEREHIKCFKGFNLNHILESYCIRSKDKEGENTDSTWVVDYKELKKVAASTNERENHCTPKVKFEAVQLPSRRDLIRRAKLLLSKPISNVKSSEKKVLSVSDRFCVLDQSNICNFFLAELLREAIKVEQKRQNWINKLLTIALSEAETRSNECAEDSKESHDLLKISKHILLTRQNSKPFVRAAKNVLRAILGIEVHLPKNASEATFLVERKGSSKVASPKTKARPVATSTISNKVDSYKRKSGRGVQSTAGDAAVEHALAVRKLYGHMQAIPVCYLKLTSIEALILSLSCSQGIPVWTENWQEKEDSRTDQYHLTWNETAYFLEAAAEAWYTMATNKVSKYEHCGKEIPAKLISELEIRRLVLSEASSLRSDPINLARKVIMLLEAVRLHGTSKLQALCEVERALGANALNWNARNMMNWSRCLGVYIDGDIIAQYAICLRPDIVPAALMCENSCLTIFSQITQQTRLRSLCLIYTDDDLLNKLLPEAVEKCDLNTNQWDDRPSWWSSEQNDDARLVLGILKFGYGGFDAMVQDDERFSSQGAKGDIPFDRLAAQVRLNCLTRELSGIDDRAQAMTFFNDWKRRTSRNEIDLRNISQTRQVGIETFFYRRAK